MEKGVYLPLKKIRMGIGKTSRNVDEQDTKGSNGTKKGGTDPSLSSRKDSFWRLSE